MALPGHASELPPEERYCTCCERALRGRLVWLEMDCRTFTPMRADAPPEHSQGWFAFGSTCAAKLSKGVR